MFEHSGQLRRFLIRIHIAVTGSLALEGITCSLVVSRRVMQLASKSGLLFVSLYLKQCSVHLQQYYAKSKVIVGSSATNVSLSRAGLPVIIPKVHRYAIMRRESRGNHLVKLYLSWFSVCRIIPLAKRPSRSTFKTITDPATTASISSQLFGTWKPLLKAVQKRYIPWISEIPLCKGISWIPTWKSTPNNDHRHWKVPKSSPNIFSSLKYEMAAFAMNAWFVAQRWLQYHPGMLWSKRVLYPLDNNYTTRVMWESLSFYQLWYETLLREHYFPMETCFLDPSPGRLTCTLTGAGKRRLFIIGNYVKQRLLYPVHDWAMRVLSRIPTDGTFDQERPIHRLSAADPPNLTFSFDLKAATDRWPSAFIWIVLATLFGESMASCVVEGCLRHNLFTVNPPFVRNERLLMFEVGTPLGYYGSWALFSLSHHYLVWLAATLAHPRSKAPFRKYAILGDDIVISDVQVAEKYEELLAKLGVQISEDKSLRSENGSIEFAKQFWVERISINLTPISARAVLEASSLVGLCRLADKYNLTRRCILRLSGAGFRVRGRILSSSLSRRWKRLRVISDKFLSKSVLPLDLWIGRGNHLKGIIVQMALSKYKPKQLVLPPRDSLWYVDEEDTLEQTLYHDWIKEWLGWVKWYCIISSAPDPSLEDLFNPPIVNHTYKRSLLDVKDVKYGFMWLCYDKGDGWSLGTTPPCLQEGGTESTKGCDSNFCTHHQSKGDTEKENQSISN